MYSMLCTVFSLHSVQLYLHCTVKSVYFHRRVLYVHRECTMLMAAIKAELSIIGRDTDSRQQERTRTARHQTQLHGFALNCTDLQCTAWICSALYGFAVHCTERICSALYGFCSALHGFAHHFTDFHRFAHYCTDLQ